ncbi:melanoregulin-like [Lampris incognitus]|uniref:melanoregulin-like n=1 Tax=Lampris incognitus TaxID=2546036 RepID=UPI0024B5ABF8|nr:melanoregulin-like [Lampris incognitus]
MKTTRVPWQPVPVYSESSDSDPDPGDETLYRPEPPRGSPWDTPESQRSNTFTWPIPDSPQSPTIRRESDKELQALINMRNQTDKDTEEWEKLNYDIHSLRCVRREVGARWRKILLQLGYQCEVENLLCVNRQSRLSRESEDFGRARELLQYLLDHTALFPPGPGPKNRYLYVMDRLISLDSAEDFVRLAQQKYPKTKG